MDEHELEQAMRDGLQRRAQRADTAAPVADRARTDVRRRRAGRLAAGLAAAAVVAVAATTVVLNQDGDPGREGVPAGPQDASDTGSDAEGVWRTEYWRDMQVDVPDSWGWGGAPPACGVGPSVSSGGQPVRGDADMPYVGRPIPNTDDCPPTSGPPVASYVWLGVDRPAGVVDLGGGFVEETVDVNGSTLTVASDDQALRERILASATGGETCMSELDVDAPSFPKLVPGDVGTEADVLNVCVYRSPDPGRSGQANLVYATTADLGRLHAYLAALEDSEEPRDQCPTLDYVEGEWVVLEIGTEDGDVFRRDVVHTFCPGIDVDTASLDGFETVRLTEAMVRPWAGEGIGAVVHGPTAGDLTGYFIGPLG
ncbi:MAG: hypothetical protein Q8O61_11110 [Nocardioides sp.]|nr:hypothetical protein [Nocardioides sp.]